MIFEIISLIASALLFLYIIVIGIRMISITDDICKRLEAYVPLVRQEQDLEKRLIIMKEWKHYSDHCKDDLANKILFFKHHDYYR